jgi:hypothetical protein
MGIAYVATTIPQAKREFQNKETKPKHSFHSRRMADAHKTSCYQQELNAILSPAG